MSADEAEGQLRTLSDDGDGWGRPYGLACAPVGATGGAGVLFVSDERAGVVRSIDETGAPGPALAEKLRAPQGLAATASQLFIAEAAAGRVVAVDLENGTAPEIIWTGVVQPSALAVHENMLYLASGGQHAVFAKDLRSPDDVSVVAGRPGTAGNMKTSSCGDGGPALEAQLFSPFGLAVSDDAVYIADSFNGRVRAVRGGFMSTVAGARQEAPRGNRGVATEINIGQPRGLACTPLGVLVSTVPGLVWRLLGDVAVPVAGTWVDGYNGDEGEASEMRLNCPCGIAWWGDRLAIADSDNRRICTVDWP